MSEDRFKQLCEAVESFAIAHATGSREDERAAYRHMMRLAGLESYLDQRRWK